MFFNWKLETTSHTAEQPPQGMELGGKEYKDEKLTGKLIRKNKR